MVLPPLSKRDSILVNYLRVNSRMHLADVSRLANIPVSTLHDALSRLEDSLIERYVSIPYYQALGFRTHIFFAVSVVEKISFLDFLMSSSYVNSVSITGHGYDFFFEGIFTDLQDEKRFLSLASTYNIVSMTSFELSSPLFVEKFLIPH